MEALFRWTRLAPLVAMLACVAAPALAQPGGGRGFGPQRGGGGIGMLLRSEEVRSELELLDDQTEKLREIEEGMRDKMREAFGGRRGGRGGERPDFEEMRSRMEEMRKDLENELSKVLTTQQMERLKQIETQQQMQRGGARALMGGPLADKLGLTEEQQQQLRERAREVQAEMDAEIQAARAAAKEKLLEVLTSEQRATLDEMTGAPFEMSDNPRGGRGMERGRRGGRPGGPPEGGRPGGRRGGRPGPPPEGEPEL